MAPWQVSCEWPSTLDTTTKVELNWSKLQDISSVPVGSTEGSVVEPFEVVHRNVMSIIKETPAKSEQALETLVQDDNPSEAMMATMLKPKSGVSEVSMTVNEELLPEPPLVTAVDEYGAEFRNYDVPTTTLATTAKREESTDVARSESHHADIYVSEFATERIKPSEKLEERELPLNTTVSTVMDRDLTEEISEEIDFPTADWSLTALHFDQSKLKTASLSTSAMAVRSDIVQEVDESAIGPAKSEGKIEMEIKVREKIQTALCEEVHDEMTSLERKPEESSGHDKCTIYAQSLEQKSDAVEDANRKRSFTSDICDLMSEEGKIPQKKIAALILDTDTVHIHTTEIPGSTDPNAGTVDSASRTDHDSSLPQQVETLDMSDEMRKPFDSHTTLDQQALEKVVNAVDSTKSSQPPGENTDRTLQTTEQNNFTGNSEPNAEREGPWTTSNGPQEVQRVMEPLDLQTVNNGPRETQHRYMILERHGGLDIRQEPAAETNVLPLDTATSELGGVETNVSKLQVMSNIEQEVGKESVSTEASVKVSWNARKQSETSEIMGALPAPPARRKLERLSCSSEDNLVEHVDKETVKGESKPTPPTRRSKEMESLSVDSEIQSEQAHLPVPTIQQYTLEEIQLPPAEVLHTPPNTRHKEKLGDERLSLDLDSPTPPERRQKERAEHQQPELEKTSKTVAVEEPLLKPTPPVRRKVSQGESDDASVVSITQKMEETLLKPTPPTRKRDSRIVTDQVSDSSDLDKTQTKEKVVEESLEKTTPAVRQKSSSDESDFITPLVSRGSEDLLVKPTHPSRRKDSRSVRDTLSKEMASQEKAVMQDIPEDLLVKPPSPVRRKGSQLSQIQEMEDTLMKPTPPSRRRGSRNFSDEAYKEMAWKSSSSTDLEKALEEPLIKPTPPVRRKVSSQIESDAVSVLSKIPEVGEIVVKPTPPTRRRDSRNMSDIVAIRSSSSTDLDKTVTQEKSLEELLLKPTPPVTRKAQEIEATLLKPTPPIRRRNSGNMTDIAASTIYGSCDLVTPERVTGEDLLKPTPPFRRKALSRTESDISIVDKTIETEETLVKPTPPSRRRDSRNVSDIAAMDLENSVTQEKPFEESIIKPAPPVRQKTTPAENDTSMVSKTQEMEETLLKPTPPTRRSESTNMSDTVAVKISTSFSSEMVPEELVIKPTPSVSKAVEVESDGISEVSKPQEIAETLVKLTPPARRRESKNDLMASEISASSDLENLETQDRADETSPAEETLVKPTPLTDSKDSRTMDEIVPKQAEGGFSSNADLDKTIAEERSDVKGLVILTPPVEQAESDIHIIAKTQEMEGKLEKPTTSTRTLYIDSETVDETETKQVESEISSSIDLDKTVRPSSAHGEVDLPKQTPLEEQEANQAESDITDKTQEMEAQLEKPSTPTKMRDSRNVDETEAKQIECSSTDLDETVRQEEEEEDLVKITPPMGQAASQAESNISSVVSKPQVPEETLVKPTPPKRTGSKIDSVTEISHPEVQECMIEPDLREEDNKVEHGNIKVSSEEALPEPITPIGQENNTVPTDLDIIPLHEEEPSIQPIPTTRDIEKSVEIQPLIKQEDEQPEKELCNALGMEPTEGLTETERSSTVQVTGNYMHVKDVHLEPVVCCMCIVYHRW